MIERTKLCFRGMVVLLFKVIIAGSRNFNDYQRLKESMDRLLAQQKDEIVIVSGAARGADKLGEQYANERGYKILSYPANWDLYGKSAGYIRNEEMAKEANSLVAFWDGQSKGTKHMIDLANKYKLQIRIIKF